MATRGRPAGIVKIAENMLTGSCVQNAVISRNNATAYEAVQVRKSMGTVHVVDKVRIDHTATTTDNGTVSSYGISRNDPDMINGLPRQGYYDTGVEMVPFYGSVEAFRKLIGS